MIDLAALVKPQVWEDGDRNGGFYASVNLGYRFSAYYSITQEDYDLASVTFGIHCHEFGEEHIWRGPKSQAKAAAEADHVARVLALLDTTKLEQIITDYNRAKAKREATGKDE